MNLYYHKRKPRLKLRLFIQILFVFLGYNLNASAQVKTTDSTFIHDSRPIIPFVVGKKDIEAQDRKWILQTLIPKLQALGDSGIILGRASSSPEGSLYINTRLAQARKNSMNALLRSYGIQADRIRYDVAPMDFALLHTLLRLEHDAYYPTLDSLYNKYGNNVLQLKEAAIRQNHGKLWLHLYHHYFPRLRSVRIMAINKSLARTEKPQMDILISSIQRPLLSLDSMMPKQEVIPLSSIAKAYRRELLSIKTNLLFDLAYMPGYNRFCPIPNVAIEYYPLHGHFTYGASFDGPWWKDYDSHKYFQLRNYQLHARYYLRSGDVALRQPGKGAAFKGFYLSSYAHAYLYNICFDENRGWEGEGWGAGLGFGYVLPLDRKEHWRMEFGLQAGYLNTRYDPYQWRCPVDPGTDIDRYYYKWFGDAKDFRKRQHSYTWIGPTRVEVTLSYDIIYRRK